jgi:heterodisulfide reductase subunit A
MMDAGRHRNIELLTYSELESVSGYVGNFRVTVRKKARSVNEKLCTGCGLCQERCPRTVVDKDYEAGMGNRKAIYRPFAQAVPNIPVIDRENCLYFTRGRCRLCERTCPTGAIDYEQQDTMVELQVGAIVVATGLALWDPSRAPQYSYGRSPNILTGIQFERLTSASGPTGGKIVTAEGKTPQSVAIIHCVGSRDANTHPYCSRICCMYALKHAHQIRQKTGAAVYDFYMDIRAFGKAYDEYYMRVQEEGVIFVRGRPAEVEVLPDGRLRVWAEDTAIGRVLAVDVDMVILATALEPQPDAERLCALLGINRTPDGFYAEAHPKLRPVETAMAGVYLAGSCQAPRDVLDTVAHAGAAAMEVVRLFNQGSVTISPTVAQVREELCSGCGECVISCPFNAIALNERGRAQVNPALCQGCGTCAAACLPGAIAPLHFRDEQLVCQIDGLLLGAEALASAAGQEGA